VKQKIGGPSTCRHSMLLRKLGSDGGIDNRYNQISLSRRCEFDGEILFLIKADFRISIFAVASSL